MDDFWGNFFRTYFRERTFDRNLALQRNKAILDGDKRLNLIIFLVYSTYTSFVAKFYQVNTSVHYSLFSKSETKPQNSIMQGKELPNSCSNCKMKIRFQQNNK